MRKKITVNIEDGERQLTFSITQMPALKLERFINKAAILLARAAGKNFGETKFPPLNALADVFKKKEEEEGTGVEKLVTLLGGLDYDEVEPLYNELLSCCKLIPDTSTPGVTLDLNDSVIEGNIESPLTLYKLRIEAAKLNFSFFKTALSSHEKGAKAQITFPKRTKTSQKRQG